MRTRSFWATLDHPDALYSMHRSTHCSATRFFSLPDTFIHLKKRKSIYDARSSCCKGVPGGWDFTLHILIYEFFKQTPVFRVFQFECKKRLSKKSLLMLTEHTRSTFMLLSYHLHKIYLLCINHTLFRSRESSRTQEKVIFPQCVWTLEMARCILASLKMT